MADIGVRILRDGVAEGEGAVSILVADNVAVVGGPRVFRHLLEGLCVAVAAGRSQGRGVVVAALERPPEDYWSLFERVCTKHQNGSSAATSSLGSAWFQVVDCYTDPLGWNSPPSPSPTSHVPVEIQTILSPSDAANPTAAVCGSDGGHAGDDVSKGSLPSASLRPGKPPTRVFSSLANLAHLREVLLAAGRDALHGREPKSKVYLVLDSVSTLLRHSSIFALASFLDSLRWTDTVSGVLLMLHSDLHQSGALATLDYLANAALSVEPYPYPQLHASDSHTSGPHRLPDGRSRQDEEPAGIVRLRQKRRTGKVREQVEAYHLGADGAITFSNLVLPPVSIPVETVAVKPAKAAASTELPFNLELTEKEKADRAKVVLPYEHQGFGRKVEIYDGRSSKETSLAARRPGRSLERGVERGQQPSPIAVGPPLGHIHYTRDSDDEPPDSDEDPDDDLDI